MRYARRAYWVVNGVVYFDRRAALEALRNSK
jgi:hypothetical protein